MARDESGIGDEEAAVRRFRPGDGPAVRRLHRRALEAAGTDPDDVAGIEDMRDVRGEYLDAGGEFLVATIDCDVVAVGGLAVESGGVGELRRIAVDPDHHRRGLGAAIVERLETAARERGLERLFLLTAARQRAATEFYPALDYAEVDRWDERGYELIRFEKRLDD